MKHLISILLIMFCVGCSTTHTSLKTVQKVEPVQISAFDYGQILNKALTHKQLTEKDAHIVESVSARIYRRWYASFHLYEKCFGYDKKSDYNKRILMTSLMYKAGMEYLLRVGDTKPVIMKLHHEQPEYVIGYGMVMAKFYCQGK